MGWSKSTIETAADGTLIADAATVLWANIGNGYPRYLAGIRFELVADQAGDYATCIVKLYDGDPSGGNYSLIGNYRVPALEDGTTGWYVHDRDVEWAHKKIITRGLYAICTVDDGCYAIPYELIRL